MRLRRLRLENLRAFPELDLELAPGWNVFTGPNGAGKTTLLEAAYVLSRAHSFRAGAREALLRRGAARYSIHATIEGVGGPLGVGLSREAGGLQARMDGQSVQVSALLHHVAVVCFEPGSHELISGASEGRRRFIDWGVFHVEPDFLRVWRTFQRTLKQRNALLRRGADETELDVWDGELVRSGVELTVMRERYVAAFAKAAALQLHELLGELGAAAVVFENGWRGGDPHERLAAAREDDRRRGFTTVGPHRADWSIAFEHAPRREHLSRGQEKLCALGCILAQAALFAEGRGEWPIVCIDDLASELDAPHQMDLARAIAAVDAQILVTGTHEPAALSTVGTGAARFHVEPGQVRRLL